MRAVVAQPGVGAGGQAAVAAELDQERPLGVDHGRGSARARSPRSTARSPSSSVRHSTASAPWPTCGTISAGDSTSVDGPPGRAARGRRRPPRWRRTRTPSPGGWPCCPAARRSARSGRRCGQLRPAAGGTGGHDGVGGQVGQPGRRPARRGGRPARAPRRGPARPAVTAGRSLAEWTARSARPSSTRGLDLRGEHALAADLGQRHVGAAVPLGARGGGTPPPRRAAPRRAGRPRGRPASAPAPRRGGDPDQHRMLRQVGQVGQVGRVGRSATGPGAAVAPARRTARQGRTGPAASRPAGRRVRSRPRP